jgi:hypothetical protein
LRCWTCWKLILVFLNYILAASQSFVFYNNRHPSLSDQILFLLLLKFAWYLFGTSKSSYFRFLLFILFLLAIIVQIINLRVIDDWNISVCTNSNTRAYFLKSFRSIIWLPARTWLSSVFKYELPLFEPSIWIIMDRKKTKVFNYLHW